MRCFGALVNFSNYLSNFLPVPFFFINFRRRLHAEHRHIRLHLHAFLYASLGDAEFIALAHVACVKKLTVELLAFVVLKNVGIQTGTVVRTCIDDFNGHLSALTVVRALVNDRHIHFSSVIFVRRLSDGLYHDLTIVADIHEARLLDFDFYVLCLFLQFKDSGFYSIVLLFKALLMLLDVSQLVGENKGVRSCDLADDKGGR